MTKLLIRLFIGKRDLAEESARARCGYLASVVGAVSNTVLFAVKLTIGLLLNSVAIMADAVNNIQDSLANIIVIAGIKFAKKPADYKHPFGHARIEYISSFIIAAFMFILGYEFMESSVRAIIAPEEIGFDIILVGILAASGLVKLWQSGFYKKLGRSINSAPLVALSKDSLNDVFIAVAIVGSVVFTHLTGIIIDGYVGAGISLIILYTGFSVAKDTVTKLIGEAADPARAAQIIEAARSHEAVLSAHDLIVHNYGPSTHMATMHVCMSDALSFNEAHAAAEKIERQVKEEFGIELLLRVDPVPLGDERFAEIIEAVEGFIAATDKRLSADDFKIVEEEGRIDVFFDLELPYDYSAGKQAEVLAAVSNAIKALDGRYNPVIAKERGFVRY